MTTKRVQFSCHVEHISTFANEEYDRTAQEVAKLTYNDMYELLTLKSELRRQMEVMQRQQQLEEAAATEQQEEEDQQSTTSSSSSSVAPYDICA
ncbi:hypothetical protein LRAMOSA03876 [Lichtheimia ramosa]|uniref:Uncharacterized protein n=1 Tax=Lichtheimia ramosa TaxID=688394 RepID=A0A077WX60_9FUNG|nr:hypothetical protein LRAMOSA03876 [Lichtheimia ramosa]